MEQNGLPNGKLSTINEVTESTGMQHLMNDSSNLNESSVNGLELEVAERILQRASECVKKMVDCRIMPLLNKMTDKTCKKFKLEADEEEKVQAIVHQVKQECYVQLQRRVSEVIENDADLQTMLNSIFDLSIELTDRSELVQVHLPIRKSSLEKLTILSHTVSETVKQNSDSVAHLEQQLRDLEQDSKIRRKALFTVSTCFHLLPLPSMPLLHGPLLPFVSLAEVRRHESNEPWTRGCCCTAFELTSRLGLGALPPLPALLDDSISLFFASHTDTSFLTKKEA